MNLDDLKKTTRQVRAPQVIGGFSNGFNGSDTLIEAIKASDERECRQMRRAFPFYLLAAVFCIFGFAAAWAGASSGVPGRAVHLGALALVFMFLCILIQRKLSSTRTLDYSKPVRSFLVESENRYRFIRPVDLWYSIPLLLLLAVTGGLSVVDSLIPRYLTESRLNYLVAVYCLFFAAVCGMGYKFSYGNWKRTKGTIFEDIRRTRRELESQ